MTKLRKLHSKIHYILQDQELKEKNGNFKERLIAKNVCDILIDLSADITSILREETERQEYVVSDELSKIRDLTLDELARLLCPPMIAR